MHVECPGRTHRHATREVVSNQSSGSMELTARGETIVVESSAENFQHWKTALALQGCKYFSELADGGVGQTCWRSMLLRWEMAGVSLEFKNVACDSLHPRRKSSGHCFPSSAATQCIAASPVITVNHSLQPSSAKDAPSPARVLCASSSLLTCAAAGEVQSHNLDIMKVRGLLQQGGHSNGAALQ